MAGVLNFEKSYSHTELIRFAKNMGDRLQHRGPDEGNHWVDANAGLLLTHRRLSVIDRSVAGRQPMVSKSGRFVLVYNGEIYNSSELKTNLEAKGIVFTGHSDTEVLLESLSQWGAKNVLPRLNGMFAFALWDREERTLLMARDRIGIKPIYWGRQGRNIFFASELKSLFGHPRFKPEVNRLALNDLVAFNYVSGPRSIYENISQLEAGCSVSIDSKGNVQKSRYWDMMEVARHATNNRKILSEKEAEFQLDSLLKDAVNKRKVSDVPLGTLLSGGVDSSTITALLQSDSTMPIKTFSIGFEEDEFNEANYARDIASHLGTEHYEFMASSRDALDTIPKLSTIYCEPFADSSQIPTHLVSAMARRHVTVALSGDGGDELFAGYNRYLASRTLWPTISCIPTPMRNLLGEALKSIPHTVYDKIAMLLPETRRPSQMGNKVTKLAELMTSVDLNDFYSKAIRFWDNTASVVIGSDGDLSQPEYMQAIKILTDPIEQMQLQDMIMYLPNDILTKVDRASMSVGLEVRVPLLDHRIIELAWSIPTNMKIRRGETKWLLRRVLDRYVPNKLIDRPKAGFALPLGNWLRGPLRDWAEDLLSVGALTRTGLFNIEPVRHRWKRHLEGNYHEHHSLWSILMAQEWHQTWIAQK